MADTTAVLAGPISHVCCLGKAVGSRSNHKKDTSAAVLAAAAGDSSAAARRRRSDKLGSGTKPALLVWQ